MLRQLLGIGERRDCEYWRGQLDDAWHLLVAENTDEAEHLFLEIGLGLIEDQSKRTRYVRNQLIAESQIGRWAAQYNRDASKASLYQQIVEQIEPNPRNWHLVSRTFYEQDDTSKVALTAYASWLDADPSTANAELLLPLASESATSPEKLALVRQIASVLPESKQAQVELCKAHLRAGDLKEAVAVARRVLELDGDDPDAHRCLGYSAEIDEDWEAAAQHYRAAHEWLRLLVASCHAERLSEAVEAMETTTIEEDGAATWLYYAGWVRYRQGKFEDALHCWRTLQASHAVDAPFLTQNARAAIERLAYKRVSSLSLDAPQSAPAQEPYASEFHLRLGSLLLMTECDAEAAESHLQRAASLRPQDPVPVTYLALCKATRCQDTAWDQRVCEELNKRYGDGSLYLWLRGLWLAESAPETALAYLSRAIQFGVEKHLPEEALGVTEWMISRLASESSSHKSSSIEHLFQRELSEGTGESNSAFLWAVAPAFGLHSLRGEASCSRLLESAPCPSVVGRVWSKIRAIHLARNEKWLDAIEALDAKTDAKLGHEIVAHAISITAANGNWPAVSDLLSQGLRRFPNDADLKSLARRLKAGLRGHLWAQRDLNSLERRLLEDLLSDGTTTGLHHDMAIVCTELGIRADRDQGEKLGSTNQIDHWTRAIGHWAVVLSDDKYWDDWEERRSEVFQVSVDTVKGSAVRKEVPSLLKDYHNQQSSVVSAHARGRHKYYAALIDYEIEVAAAMRYLTRACLRRGEDVPSELIRLPSALLLRAYDQEVATVRVPDLINQTVLSPREAQLLRQAFSPLADVHALVAGQQYRTALERLANHRQESTCDEASIGQMEQQVLKLHARALIADLRWKQALASAKRLAVASPLDKDTAHLLAEAAVGWANWQLQQGTYEAAAQELRCLLRILEVLESARKASFSQVTAEELQSIPGIGASLARRIIAFRQKQGVVTAPRQLKLVPGVGEEIASRIAERLSFQAPTEGRVEVMQAKIERLTQPNFHQATVQDLQSIPGVGEVLAERIIALRQKGSTFASLKELKQVPGLGEEIVARIASRFVSFRPVPASELEDIAPRLPAEVRATFSETLVLARFARWESEAQNMDRRDLEKEKLWFEKALVLDPNSARARSGAAAICHNLALKCLEDGDSQSASVYAHEAFDYDQSTEALNLVVAADHDCAIDLGRQHRYQEAISLVEPLVNLPYDRSIISLEPLLSGLYTDTGVALWNGGRLRDAVSCWQAALQYDSTNSVARRNLNIAAGGYW